MMDQIAEDEPSVTEMRTTVEVSRTHATSAPDQRSGADADAGDGGDAAEASSVIIRFDSEVASRGASERQPSGTRSEVSPEEIEMVMRALQGAARPPPNPGAASRPALAPIVRDGYLDSPEEHPASTVPAPPAGPATGAVLEALPVSFDDFVAHGGAPVVGIPIECHPAASNPPNNGSAGPASPSSAAPRRLSQPSANVTAAVVPAAPNIRFTEELTEAWRSCRAMRMYCISHIFIIALMLIKFVWSLAFCVLPLIGFFGAQLYRVKLLRAYLVSFVATIGLRAYVTFALVSGVSSSTMYVIFIVLGVVGAVLEIHIARHVKRVAEILRNLSHEQRVLLRGGTVEFQVA